LLLNPHRWYYFITIITVYFKCSSSASSTLILSVSLVLKCFSHYILRFWTAWTLRLVKLSIAFSGLLTFSNISETSEDLHRFLFFNVLLLLIGFTNQMSINNETSSYSLYFILIFYYLICSVFIRIRLLIMIFSTFWRCSTFKVIRWVTSYTFGSVSSIYIFAPQYQVILWTVLFVPWRYSSFIFTLPWFFSYMSCWPYFFICFLL